MRVCVKLDLLHLTVVRIWKGYRDAQVCWIRSRARTSAAPSAAVASSASSGSRARPVLHAVMYAPRRGLLELWNPFGKRYVSRAGRSASAHIRSNLLVPVHDHRVGFARVGGDCVLRGAVLPITAQRGSATSSTNATSSAASAGRHIDVGQRSSAAAVQSTRVAATVECVAFLCRATGELDEVLVGVKSRADSDARRLLALRKKFSLAHHQHHQPQGAAGPGSASRSLSISSAGVDEKEPVPVTVSDGSAATTTGAAAVATLQPAGTPVTQTSSSSTVPITSAPGTAAPAASATAAAASPLQSPRVAPTPLEFRELLGQVRAQLRSWTRTHSPLCTDIHCSAAVSAQYQGTCECGMRLHCVIP